MNGRGPTGKILNPGTPIVQINLTGAAESDDSVDPAAGHRLIGMPLRDLPDPDFAALQATAAKAKTRTWRFERGNGGWTVNGQFFDEDVVNAAIPQESEEVWIIQNPGGGWRHPVHIHFEEHRVLSRNGVPVQAEHVRSTARSTTPAGTWSPADQRGGPHLLALPRHEGALRDALPQRGA